VNAYLGEISDPNVMSKSMPIINDANLSAAKIFQLNATILFVPLTLSSIEGKAIVKPVLGAKDVSLIFGRDGTGTIGTPQTPGTGLVVGNTAQVGTTVQNLSNSLLASNSLRVCAVASLICIGGPDSPTRANLQTVLNRVGSLLSNTTDPLLDNLLAALGIELGHATAWVNGARCGVPVLI
jgi:hypothetical protein